MAQRTLDEFAIEHDHARPVHPLRALIANSFYLNGIFSTEGGLWIVAVDAILFVPLIMAAFFYPWQALTVAVVLLVISFAGYEGYIAWRKRHPNFRV